MDEDCLVAFQDAGHLRARLAAHRLRTGRACFAEQYIEGREFNISLLAGPDGPQVLPPAEIDFSAFPPGKPRIVGYAAKWTRRRQYQQTPRRFDFPDRIK
jgi:D-alanine-D-alanine ligase